jgi:hypothetical protein
MLSPLVPIVFEKKGNTLTVLNVTTLLNVTTHYVLGSLAPIRRVFA